jgi:hypothetical protein
LELNKHQNNGDKTMKKMKDIKKMKKQECLPYKSEFHWFITDLKNDFTTRLDSADRIAAKLNEWDLESKSYIVKTMLKDKKLKKLKVEILTNLLK